MRVLVCGGRDFDNQDAVYNTLTVLHDKWNITSMIHGGANGADTLAGAWAHLNDIEEIVFKADWQKHGRAAGPIRNKKILDEGKPDVVVAFPGSKGTANMVKQAKAAGVRIWGGLL